MKAGITDKSFVKVNKDISRKVKVQDHCKTPCTINLAKRWIKKDRDHSKLIKSINHPSIVVNARGVLGEKSAFSPSMHLWSCHAFALYFYFF